MNKTHIVEKVIDIEGGFVDDPSDSGGATKYGITEKTARSNGYTGHMKDLTFEEAFNIYIKKWWEPLLLDQVLDLSPSLADEILDTAINMGKKRAVIFLQRALNSLNNRAAYYDDLIVDGLIGKKTIRALEIYVNFRGNEGADVLLSMLNCLQGNFYIELAEKREKDEKFIYGWFKNRVQ